MVAVALGVLTSLSRIPFRSHYLFAWDSANFALALDQYNVTFHQPQPPGYPLYVASAWLVRHIIPDANAAYVALSIVVSGVAVVFLALAGARLFGRLTALLAAVLLATSSVFWSQGEVAYPYAFLAACSSLVAWLCLSIRVGGRHAGWLTVVTGGLLGLVAGFRSELLPFLAPLWLYTAWFRPGGRRERGGTILLGAVAMGALVLAWYVPMVQKSGGWAAYQAASGGYYEYFIQTTSGAGKLLLGLLENARALVNYLYNGLGLALLPMLYFVGRFFAPQRIVADWRARFLLVWLLPPLAFYITVHLGNPGYVLTLVPALCLYATESLRGLLGDVQEALGSFWQWSTRLNWLVPVAVGIVLVISAINAALFLVANGEGRWKEIRQIDRILGREVAYIRANFAPDSTLLVAYDRSRQLHYYLPRYHEELLFNVAVAGAVTDTSRYWERRTIYRVPPGVTAVVFPDLERNTSDAPGLVQPVDLGDGVTLFVARVQPGDEVRYGYQYATATRG